MGSEVLFLMHKRIPMLWSNGQWSKSQDGGHDGPAEALPVFFMHFMHKNRWCFHDTIAAATLILLSTS